MLPKLALWLAALGGAALGPVADAARVPVTGVRTNPGSPVPLRLNINDMQARGGPVWDLFLLSLKEMHEMSPTDQLSFFQIAGIHGKPYVQWNDAGGRRSDGWGGYCPHGEKNFLPWHRPYLALYEQEVVKHARRIASTYPQRYRAQYQRAADQLRVPFWDWASDQSVPQATVPGRVRVNTPSGQALRSTEIENPLATYRFPRNVLNGQFGEWDSQRRPQIYHCVAPYSYPTSANSNLRSRPYKQWTYDALTRSGSFDEFASPEGGGVGIEQIHNAVHWDGSCGGQFLALDFTAFDPLFMMHHCNADRLWAYYSAMNPRSSAIFSSSYTGGARFATPSGTRITPDSPLEPFYQTNGQFHTSRTVSSIRNFGYSYEGLEYWSKSEGQMRADAVRLVNRLYSPGGFSAAGMLSVKKPQTRYFVQLELDMAQVPRPCQVQVLVSEKFAGSMVVMQQPGHGIMQGGFPIDNAVKEAGLNKLGKEEAVAKIKEVLKVKIIKGDGETVAVESVSSFKWELEAITYTPAAGEEGLPKFTNPQKHALKVSG
ncbi:tyrosinase [Hirsutella rhossiliensis]|uniref:tyrosinase n=1 Tax=Hirsutella rhossiliensis TaxID=111463 RepID=A0A9P8MNI4_9HYPO|nr:tyrosinase [Hirsutella rhossiliensis]KAH0958688.1 tyrosinase [Hirsutella rhossiliensis]